MLGVLGYRGLHVPCPVLGLSTWRTSTQTPALCDCYPTISHLYRCGFFFSPVEFFGNSTTCSTPNKFSTWTTGGLRQGTDLSLHSALPRSLKKTSSFATFEISWLSLPAILSFPPLTLALVLVWELAPCTLSLKEVLMSGGNYDPVMGQTGRSRWRLTLTYLQGS